MYSIARASADNERGESINRLPYFTCLMTVDQLMETVPCMTQLKEHVCIFDVVADLVLDNSGAIYEPWPSISVTGTEDIPQQQTYPCRSMMQCHL